MSGTELAAMTGTVANVMAAFEHGENLVKKIVEKRSQEGAPLPPPTLEQSLIRGPRAIREAFETGWETYGEAFRVENDRSSFSLIPIGAYSDWSSRCRVRSLQRYSRQLTKHSFPAPVHGARRRYDK